LKKIYCIPFGVQDTVFVKLINTTVFRLSLSFAAIFVLIFTVAITLVYFITFAEIETQTDLELLHEMDELEIHHHAEDNKQLIVRVNDRERYGEHLGHFYALLDSNRKYISGNQNLALLVGKTLEDDGKIHYTEKESKIGETVLRIAHKKLANDMFLVVAQENNSLYELREHTLSAILYSVLITLFLALIIGTHMGRLVLRRINKINEGMDQSIAANFKQLISVPETDDEFQALTLKLNSMLERIEKLLSGMRQVTDNIAHDLRSPLSRMRSRLEVTLLQSRSEEEYKDVMAQAVNDCDELLKTFNSLLSIAQVEAGVRGKDWQTINLVDLLNHLAELYEVIAEEKGQKFVWSTSLPVEVVGNKELLAQAVSNLIENAIKYTSENGEITLEVDTIDGHPIIRVMDNGPGIDEKDRERVLERFQRLDSARSSPGNGLGLSLVKAVTTLHGAQLMLSDNKPGLKVELIF